MKLCPQCETGYADGHVTCPTHGVMLSEIRDLRPGMLIRNTYRIVRKLGQGGMGAVYLAEHTLMGEKQALKFLSSELSHDEAFASRFLREVRTLRQVRHRNVVDAGNLEPAEDDTLFFSMEYVDGPDLRKFLHEASKPFDVKLALEITRGIAEGLGAAHAKGMVHRDIKPENILMAREGDTWVPKIADFGIVATKEDSRARTLTGRTLLTPPYAAPEQWQGVKASELDGRTDLYALGCLLFEMLTGRTPFDAENYEGWAVQHKSVAPKPPSSLRPELSQWAGLDALTLRLLAKERGDRPRDVQDVLSLLAAVNFAMPKIPTVKAPERRTKLEVAPGQRKRSWRIPIWIWVEVAVLILVPLLENENILASSQVVNVGRFWPVLLVGIGLVALAEWAFRMRRRDTAKKSPRFYSITVSVAILLVLLFLYSALHHVLTLIRSEPSDADSSTFSLPAKHETQRPTLARDVPAGAQIQIQNPHGDVSFIASNDSRLKVDAHLIAFAQTDDEAKKIFDSQQVNVTVNGETALVKANGVADGEIALTISVPRGDSISVWAGRGLVKATGLSGNLYADAVRGDVELKSIQGYAHVRLSGHDDLSASDIHGDLHVEGSGGSLTIADIHGKGSVEGDYIGDTHLERVDSVVNLRSSTTDLVFERLPGTMTLESDSLHASQVVGPVRIICSRSKDIEMSDIYGDTYIQNKIGRIEIGMAGSYKVDVIDSKGDVDVSLPRDAGVFVNAHTMNGAINSDFPLQVSGDNSKSATGAIGRGGPNLTLSTAYSDIWIRKGEYPATLPPVGSVSVSLTAGKANGQFK